MIHICICSCREASGCGQIYYNFTKLSHWALGTGSATHTTFPLFLYLQNLIGGSIIKLDKKTQLMIIKKFKFVIICACFKK